MNSKGEFKWMIEICETNVSISENVDDFSGGPLFRIIVDWGFLQLRIFLNPVVQK